MENIIKRKPSGRKYPPVDYELLPNQARRLREEAGLTLRTVGTATRLFISSLHRYELTGTGIDRINRAVLADFYNTTLSALETPGYQHEAQSAAAFASEVNSRIKSIDL